MLNNKYQSNIYKVDNADSLVLLVCNNILIVSKPKQIRGLSHGSF